jgi:hypothetical protein
MVFAVLINQLSRVREMKERTGDNPQDNQEDSKNEGPY